jgi:hypothetical protein
VIVTPRKGARNPIIPTADDSFHLERKTAGSNSAPARKVRTMAPVPARNVIHSVLALRTWLPANAPDDQRATVPMTISDSAVDTRSQLEASTASRASKSRIAATNQTRSMESLRFQTGFVIGCGRLELLQRMTVGVIGHR